MADELNKLRAEHADEMALAVIEHLGPAALAGGTMSVLEAFERGFIAARRQTASGEPVALPVKLADDELERSISRACPTCRGNDSDAPCAYPSKDMPGCLRDARLDAEKEAQGDVPPLPPHRGYTGPHKVYYESDLRTYAAAYAANPAVVLNLIRELREVRTALASRTGGERAAALEEAAALCDDVCRERTLAKKFGAQTAEGLAAQIRALAAQPAQQGEGLTGWISVSERLPEDRGRHYQVAGCCVKTYGPNTNYPGEGQRGIYQDWVIRKWPQNFTHWMPLPAPPAIAAHVKGEGK